MEDHLLNQPAAAQPAAPQPTPPAPSATGPAQKAPEAPAPAAPEKFCKFCGGKIHADAVICPLCGRQVEEMKGSADASPQQIVINNTNTNTNSNINQNTNTIHSRAPYKKAKSKWVALLLCFFLGIFGAHKFYEGKIGMGILYLLTGGLLVIGVVIDFIRLLFRPNPYYI